MEKINKATNISPPDTSKSYLTTSEVATYLGLSIQTIYKLTSKREFPIYKPGNKKIYIKREDLDEWIEKNEILSTKSIEKLSNKILLKSILK